MAHDHTHGAHSHAGHSHGAHHHGHVGHTHGLDPGSHTTAFAIGTALNFGFVLVEFGFGYAANSLALISDAIHNLSDVAGLLLAWGGAWLATRSPTRRRTYGFRRASILAALGNAALLLFATGAIAVEAVQRWLAPEPVAGVTVMVVAAAGILVNGVTAWLFMRGRERDLNVRGAFQHMAADALVSAAVVVAALAIRLTGWNWLDPATSLLVAAVVLIGTWKLARASLDLALDAVPDGVDVAAIADFLGNLPGVTAVSDLHVWPMSTTETAMTAHLVRPGYGLDDAFLGEARDRLGSEFGLAHVTLQVGAGAVDATCSLLPRAAA